MSYLLIVSTFIQFLKWPVALTALAFLPSAVWALGYQITTDVLALALALVLSGAAAYALLVAIGIALLRVRHRGGEVGSSRSQPVPATRALQDSANPDQMRVAPAGSDQLHSDR